MSEAKLSPEAQAQLAELSISLAHNPKTRKAFTKLVQEVDPSKRFPDVEADDLRDTIKNEFEVRDQQAEARRIKAQTENQRADLLESGRYKEEDVKEIEKIMEKHGISDYDVAAKVYSADTKPASPTSDIKSRTWQMPQLKKEDLGNLTQNARDKAYATIDEIRGRRKQH